MDFRILEIGAHSMLLERFHDEGEHQVYLIIYMDLVNRHEEWICFETPDQARTYIREYTIRFALEFLERARVWYATLTK